MKNQISVTEVFTPLDWWVFYIILIASIGVVILATLRKKTSSQQANLLDYLILGRSLTLPLFVATLVATWYGGIFGVTQIAFEHGIYNFITQGFFWYLTYILFALFLVKKIRGYKAITIPELVGEMFGPKSRVLSAIFNFFNVMPIAYAISLGLFIELMFGIGYTSSVIIGVVFVIVTSVFGGFRAVVYSDTIQFVVMCLAVLCVVVVSVFEFGGLDYLVSKLPETHFQPLSTHSISSTLVWGLIACATLIDPNFYQRSIAAKDTKTAQVGILISTFIWFCFDICTTLGGMYARAAIPEADSSKAYFYYALQILPSGLRGFVCAGILATILSTLDAFLFVASTTLTYDLAPQSLRKKKWFHALGLVIVGMFSVGMAFAFEKNIPHAWRTMGSYFSACLLLPVLCGYIFPKKISDIQFVLASLCALIVTTLWLNIGRTGFWADVDAIYVGSLTTLVVLAGSKLLNVGAVKKTI